MLEQRRLLATVPVDSDAAANAVTEGVGAGTAVGLTASSTSGDPGNSAVAYSLSDDAGGRFAINPASGVVTVAGGPPLDGPASHAVTVVATDGAGGAASQTFSIAIVNVGPTLTATGEASVEEGGPYTLRLSSADPGTDTITSWTVDWGDGSGSQTFAGGPPSVSHVYSDGGPRQRLGTTLLNELKVNAPGPHGPYEYAELRGDPGATLDDLYFVSCEGDAEPEGSETQGAGTAELVIPLAGRTVGKSGLVAIIASTPGYTIPSDTTVVTTTKLNTAGTSMENGSNSFMLVSSPTPIVEWTDYDGDNDGFLELPTGAVVLDAVGWTDGGVSDKVYGRVVLTQSAGVADAATRFFGNTTANSPGAWYNSKLTGGSDTVSYSTSQTSQNFPSGGALTPGASNVPANVLPPPRLSELKVNPPTLNDNPYEYIEIKGAPQQTLTRLFFVSLESDVTATPGGIGRADMVVNLSGLSLGSNGLLAVKSPTGGHPVPTGTAVVPDAQLDTSGGGLENGSNSFLLIASLNTLLEGSDYDANNDGMLELPAGAVIIDAVGWSDGDVGDVVYGGAVLTQAGGGAAQAATRFAADDTPASASAWYSGALAGMAANTLAYDAALATANFPAGGALTPGDDNVPAGAPPPRVIITPDGYTIAATATDEDGSYRSNAMTVTVVDVPPRVAISGATSATVGNPYGMTLGGVTDPGADTVTSYIVHWGDGLTDTYASNGVKSHVYSGGPVTYAVSVDLVNEDGTFLDRANGLTVTVSAAAPTLTISGPSSVAEGDIYTLNLSSQGSSAVTSWTIDWGDGNALQTVTGNSPAVDHVYADGPRSYTITATATDGRGTYNSNALAVTVTNVVPTIVVSGADFADEGSDYSVTLGAVSDRGTDTVTSYVVRWGDGTSSTYTTAGIKTHSYSDGPNTYTLTVDLVDEDGTHRNGGNALGVAVNNLAPTVSGVINSGPVNVGSPVTVMVTASDAAGAADALLYSFDWDNNSIFEDGPFSASSAHRIFAAAGSYTVNVRVSDGDGGAASGSTVVTVNSVAPNLTISGAPTVNEGSPYTLGLSSGGSTTISSWTINWGDGTVPQTVDGNPPSVPYVYADGTRTHTVTATATDGTGTYSANAVTVTVNNVAPAITITGAAAVDEGFAYGLSLGAVTDPGADAVSSYVVNWGDGTSNAYTTPGVKTHTYADGPASHAITVNLIDEDGTFLNRANPRTVSVNNLAPTLAISGPTSVNEGDAYSLTLGAVTDPGADTVRSYVVRWGDGSSSTYNTAGVKTHVYADGAATYGVAVDLDDEDGTFVGRANALSVEVKNVAPSVAVSGPVSVDEGADYGLMLGAVSDPGADSVSSYVVNWGDGTSNTFSGAGLKVHTYGDGPISYAVTVDLVDEDGTHRNRGDVVSVQVNNVAPTLALAQHTVTVEEGQAATNVATAFDRGDDVVSLTASTGNLTQNPDGTCTWSFDALDGPGQSQSVTITATDTDGASSTATFSLVVNNVAPTIAWVSATRTVNEGGTVTLEGAFTDPGVFDNHTLVVDWGPGEGGPETVQLSAGAGSFSVTHRYLDDNPSHTASDVQTIGVRLTDSDGGSAAVSATTTVNNVAPEVTLQGDATGARGQGRGFHGSFTDVGSLDTWTAVVNYGDGSGAQPLALNPDKTFAFDRVYTASGTYTVRVTVTDDDGGSRQASRTVVISAVDSTQSDPGDPSRRMLVVGGTTSSDLVQLANTVTGVSVTINGALQGVFNPTGRVIVFGQDGDDTVDVGAAVLLPAEVYGGDGNDRLSGGGGATNLLLGGTGNDTLNGGAAGRNVLIGGAGADTLNGTAGDDILIGGTTAYDASPSALRAVVGQWAVTAAYAQRVSTISTGTFSNGAVRLSAATVFNDGAADVLTGNLGDDWFFSGASDTVVDRFLTETETRV